MDQFLQTQTAQYRKSRKRRQWLRGTVRVLSAAVVFCTTYALILPAITMEQEAVCGLDEHTHSAQCYAPGYPFQCSQTHTDAPVLHTHEGLCFDEAGILICPLPEVGEHLHEDACYSITQREPCSLPETEGHSHGEDCWEHSEEALCGLAEAPAHTHTEECYSLTDTYICGQEEVPAHLHTEECYAEEPSLVCGQDELEAHFHGELCYSEETVLSCGQTETPAHFHGEDCSVLEDHLVCELPETEAHFHTEGCYHTETLQVCTLPEDETHSHGDGCFEESTTLACGMEETEGHSHSPECYEQVSRSICTLTETEGHSHDDSCYTLQQKLTCTLAETEGHQHSESCYQRQLLCQTLETEGHSHTDLCKESELTCTLPEGPGHTHTDACLTRLICTLEEVEAHTHTEECLGSEIRDLTCLLPELQAHTHSEACGEDCQLPEIQAHVHTEQCLMDAEQAAAALVCGLEAHEHDESCYQPETLPTEEGYICGFGSHTHTDGCLDENGELVCNIPEHVHNIACVLEDYDPNADVESAADWESTFQHIPMTGNWPEDVLAIARSQLGYTESQRNCFLYEDGTIRGYTRYGAWYGSPYGDWCAMFVSFCLHYGGVEEFPLEAGCNPWAEKLQQIEAYHSSDYQPKPGDLVFFDWEGDASLDHVGLVSDLAADGSIVTIEGNSENTVRYCTYPLDDPRLAGYGELPAGKPEPQIVEQSAVGADYTVTVTYDAAANLPEDVQLVVREIPQDSEEYAMYYLQAVEAVQGPEPSETPVEIPFARFFDISFVSGEETIEPEGPVEVVITYQDQIDIAEDSDSKAVHFADTGIEVLDAQTNVSENQADTFQFTQNSFSVTGTVITTLPGMSNNLTHAKNTLTDAFLYDPYYYQYYNANSPIGTAGSFHIVAFDTANLNVHTNGNVLANNLNANSNFGTNGFEHELSYVQNYVKVNGGSASHLKHVLVIGSSNTLSTEDNGNAFSINGTKIDRPQHIVQDQDTATAPFIDLNRVRAEVQQIGANLAGYDDVGLNIIYNDQYNRIQLNNPDGVGILNVTPSNPSVFGKHRILLDGFQSGHNGSIVINVNCAGYKTVNLPNEALIVVDGREQNTNEVTEFSNGKVLWNFLNASGVTINANRMTGMVIAPGATVNINQNLNGTVVADVVNVKAESHRTDFTGKIVPHIEEDEEPTERSITIQKIKAGYVGTTLSGAKFELYEPTDGVDWQKVETDTILTDKTGCFYLKNLQPDTAYRLKEIEAPTGYKLATEPFDFWIPSATNITSPNSFPADFKGTAVTSGGVFNIANEPDDTVDTTKLTVKKTWVKGVLPLPSRISVDVYQIATTGDQASEPVLHKTITLTEALNWEYEVTDLPKSVTAEDGTVTTYTYTIQEHPVPGFMAAYSENNARGITEETILITNTEVGDGYVLPETGGNGIQTYTVLGLALTLSALLWAAIQAYQRKEEAS